MRLINTMKSNKQENISKTSKEQTRKRTNKIIEKAFYTRHERKQYSHESLEIKANYKT